MSTAPDLDKPPPIEYVFTNSVPPLLEQLGISLLVTTYQAQFVMALSANGPRMTMTLRHFERPTGLALRGTEMVMCTRRQIWFFRATGELRDLEGRVQPYDRVLAPRGCHVTGDVSAHEAAWVGSQLVFVNTRFSCLSTLHPDWSFVPWWRPPFVSATVPEDRCHLNGMAVDDAGLQYVTVLGRSDVKEGWREGKATEGMVLQWPSGETVAQGFAMPHSPRLHRGTLYVLDSGRGELARVDVASGARQTVTRLPGYLRGLWFHEQYAFVGLCKMREHREFSGMPIERETLKCAVYIVDLRTGETVGFVEFTRGVEELFDIKGVPGVARLQLIGMEEDTVSGLYVMPPEG